MGLVNSYQAQQFGQYIPDEAFTFMKHVAANKIIEELDMSDIDIDVAQQYSDVYRSPWAGNKNLVQRFLDTHKSTVEYFVFKKCVVAICDAMNYLKKFSNKSLLDTAAFIAPANNDKVGQVVQPTSISDETSRILPIPLTTAMIDQLQIVLNRLAIANRNGDIAMNSVDVDLQGDVDSIAHMFKIYHNTMYIDRPLMTDDGGVYINSSVVNTICDIVKPMLRRIINTNYKHPVHFDQIKLINALIGIIMSCYTTEDRKGLSVSEEEFYQRYITKNDTRSSLRKAVLPMVRPFSNKSPLYVLNLPLRTNTYGTYDKAAPMYTSLDVCTDNSMKDLKSGTASTLSERYLVYYVTDALWHPNSIKTIPIIDIDTV